MAYAPLHKRQSRERGGPSRVPAYVHLHKRYSRERGGPSRVPAYVPLHKRQSRERGGPSRVPAYVHLHKRHSRERGGSSRVPAYVHLHQPHSRHRAGLHERHLWERGDPSRVPAYVPLPVYVHLHERHSWERGGLSRVPAYVPLHERHSRERGGPSHVPALFEWRVKKPLISRLPDPIAHQSGKIDYADTAISRWLAVGLDDDGDHLPSSCFLKTVSVEAIEWPPGEKRLALAKSCVANEVDEMGRDHRRKPWVRVAETVMPDLVRSFEVLRSEIKDQSMGETKPTLIARFGKIHFRGSPSFPVETCGDMVTEASLKRLKKSFYSNLPSFYMENVTQKVIPEIGLSFKDEKDIYHVKFCDNSRPGVTICCKCNVIKAEQRLELYKVELGQIRQMVVDVSCLNKDLDMRLMLRAKRLFVAISENEKNSIRDLIASVVLDSTVKGGLRWPLRKEFSWNRYRVIGAWHTVSMTYNNSSMRLKVKHADRFDFRYSQGQVTEEVTLKLNGITSELNGQSLGTDSVSDMLKDAVKIMWEHFLSYGNTVV